MKAAMMIVFCMIVSGAAFAQRHHQGKEEKAAGRLERMKKVLTLTPEQETKIKALDDQFVTAHKKLKADTAISVGSWHTRISKLKTDHHAAIKQVLTEVQWTKWSSERTNRKGGGKGRYRNSHGHHG